MTNKIAGSKKNKPINNKKIFYIVDGAITDNENTVKTVIKNFINNYNFYNLTHQSDLDGITSSALLLHSNIISLDKIYFGNYSERDVEKSIYELKKIKGSNNCLIFTDINNLDKSNLVDFLKKFREAGNKVIVLDHHPLKVDINDIAKILDVAVVGENKFCGADLVNEYIIKNIGNDDTISNEIVNIAHKSDFYLYKGTKDEYIIEKLSKIIDYINSHSKNTNTQNKKLKAVIKYISINNYNNKKINKFFEKYKREENKYINLLLNKGNIFELKNIHKILKVDVGFSKNLKSNNACEKIFEKTNADIAIFVNIKSGSVSIRRKDKCKVDLTKLASYFGGGGHPYASGFNLDKESLKTIKTKKGKQKLLDKISKTINKL